MLVETLTPIASDSETLPSVTPMPNIMPSVAMSLAAQLLVSNGLGFEGWIDRLAEAVGFKGRRIVASAGAKPDADPHCWQDVACARRYVANIAEGLAASDPANAARYRASHFMCEPS